MKRFVIRADDLGYSEAVNLGIAKTVREGIIRNVGLMPNMPTAAAGLKLLEGYEICLGQHTNVCLGKPCADPALIPSMVDSGGNFKSSKEYRAAYAAGEDFVNLNEAIVEIEAQYKRFLELAGCDPAYFEGHAVTSKNIMRAIAVVAKKYGLKLNDMVPGQSSGSFNGKPVAICDMSQTMAPDYDAVQALKNAVAIANKDVPNVYVCHPGFLDAYILRTSSLTVNRTKETEMLCDPAVKAWLDEQGVELITYDGI